MEAVIAVLYLEGGMDAARPFIQRYWGPAPARHAARRDAKTALQEWAHQAAGPQRQSMRWTIAADPITIPSSPSA
jgi:dsRNA-specific ribonuclease